MDTYLSKNYNNCNTGTAANPNNSKKVIFKNCIPFTDCISKINYTQVDNAKDIDVVMPMYNLKEYNGSYSQKSGSLWRHYRDEPIKNDAEVIAEFTADDNSDSFKFKQNLTGQTNDDGTKDIEIMVLVKYLNNFWRTLEMPLINCDINLILNLVCNLCYRSSYCTNQATAFKITDTKLTN